MSRLRVVVARGDPLERGRTVGYELSGARFLVTLRPRDLGLAERQPSIRPIEAQAESALQEVYATYAAELSGHLDRGAYVWRRVRKVENEPARGYLVETDRGAEVSEG